MERTVTLGRLKTGKEARKVLEASGRYVHHAPGNEISPFNSATDLLDRIPYSDTLKNARVSARSGASLGLKNNHTIEDLLAVAPDPGFSSEASVMTAIDYKDQPAHSCILVAMNPVADSCRNLFILSLVVSSLGPMLWTHHCLPGQKWPDSVLWLIAS